MIMASNQTPNIVIGPLQIQVMNIVWKRGKCTVHDALAFINDERDKAHVKTLAYTTVLTVMRNLSRRDFLVQIKGERAHSFEPKMSEDEFHKQMAAYTVGTYYKGDVKLLLKSYDAGIKV